MRKIGLLLLLALLTGCGQTAPQTEPSSSAEEQTAAVAEEQTKSATSSAAPTVSEQPSETAAVEPAAEVTETAPAAEAAPAATETPQVPQAPAAAQTQTAPQAEPPAPTPQSVCTLSVRCDTLLTHLDELAEGTRALVPSDGVLLAAQSVPLQADDTVFSVLERTLRAQNIHLEFSKTPAYDAVYIEGIGNLYEFDCGALSGWMYRVNGTFPQVGCSQMTLVAGDTVEWVYTCDLGADVGGTAVAGQQR